MLGQVPIDGVTYLKTSKKGTGAFLCEHQACPQKHLVGQVRIRLAHEVDLGAHLREAEVLIVETDRYLSAFWGPTT